MAAATQRGTSDRRDDGDGAGLAKPTHCVACGGFIPPKTPLGQLAWVNATFRPNGKGWAHGRPSCKELERGGFGAGSAPGPESRPGTDGFGAEPEPVPKPAEVPMAAGPALEGRHADLVAEGEDAGTPTRAGDKVSFVLTIPGPEPYTSVRLGVERLAEAGSTLEAEFAVLAERVGAQAAACVEKAMRAAREVGA